MTRTVALLGATGYTGRLTAAELERKGITHRVGGRSKSRLAEVPSTGERHVVDLDDPSSLDAFLDGVDALITCVGPFAQLGMPVVEAAVRTGTPYVDSTGEPAFMAEVYRRFRNAGTPVVPACGFDYVPGDLGVAVAVEELGRPPEEVDVVYAVHGGKVTRGTARSGIGALTEMRPLLGRLSLPGLVDAVRLPWGEELTVPLHQPQATVRTGLAAPGWVARTMQVLGPAAPYTMPLARLAKPLLDRWVERLPEGPSETERGRTTSQTFSVVRAGGDQARVVVRVRDAYGMTARLLVGAALQVTGRGAMATAEALPARAFLDAMSYEDEGGSLSWKVL
jgi:short subunit dehydrogenase-like uncharacterized protein